jgi:hypothetical protein
MDEYDCRGVPGDCRNGDPLEGLEGDRGHGYGEERCRDLVMEQKKER